MYTDNFHYIIRLFQRIKFKILFWSIFVAMLFLYFSRFIPKTYTVNMSIYTGIVSSYGLDETNNIQDSRLRNTFENIINLMKSDGVLERVSIKLLAICLVSGDIHDDNQNVKSDTYKRIIEGIPQDVLSLVVKDSLKVTERNLTNYFESVPGNFIYELQSSMNPHFGLKALKSVLVRRLGFSDIVQISYTSNDPGISLNTVKLLGEEMRDTYDFIRYSDVNEVVAYFEKQLSLKKHELDSLEHLLMRFNQDNRVINYPEQTKALALSYTSFEDRREQIQREYEGSYKLMLELESQMEVRAKLVRSNTQFRDLLDSLSRVNGYIVEQEIFSINNSTEAAKKRLNLYQEKLKAINENIMSVKTDMNEAKYSKGGIIISTLADRWLEELIKSTRLEKELEIINARLEDFNIRYSDFSPIGAQLNSKEREIRVCEESYLKILYGLNLAKLKQKNIQLTSSSLNTISTPTFPLYDNGNKKMLVLIVAIFLTVIFVIAFNILKDILDRSLRDKFRAKRVTGVDVIGAFPNNQQLLYRAFIKSCYREVANYICNKLNLFIKKDSTLYINVISVLPGEGKTFVIRQLMQKWRHADYRVKYLRAGRDFDITNSKFYQIAGVSELLGNDSEKYDVVIIEHEALHNKSVPMNIINTASINLLIINSRRSWNSSDNIKLQSIKEKLDNTVLEICLTNAVRYAVEDFTNKLLPHSIK